MKRTWIGIVLGLCVAAAGCGGNPLDGTWTNTQSNAGSTFTTALTLGGDGTASMAVSGTGSCNGMMNYTGVTWSSTADTITFSGTPACSGTIACTVAGTNVNIDCSMNMGIRNGACMYLLSGGNNTLTLSNCSGQMSGSSTAYTRQM